MYVENIIMVVQSMVLLLIQLYSAGSQAGTYYKGVKQLSPMTDLIDRINISM